MKNTAFIAVCSFFGSQIKTAKVLGVSSRMINSVVHGRRPVPANWCPIIEEATGGVFPCELLRPDIHWYVLRESKEKVIQKNTKAA